MGRAAIDSVGRKPAWLRVRHPGGGVYERLQGILASNRVHTVCRSAGCPNIGKCWSAGTATLMLLGRRCSRSCRFCGVGGGPCEPLDRDEPRRITAAVKAMKLSHVVVTSVTRDDLPDGGAAVWVEAIRQIRRAAPAATIEALVPDFLGRRKNWQEVFAARPDVLAHNVETVPRLYPLVRPAADFDRSLGLLRAAAEANLPAKSGLMVGLGETISEVIETLRSLRCAGVRMVTVGQYLRPSPRHLAVARYVRPAEFDELSRRAADIGFEGVACGPLVRSSYRAEQLARAIGLEG